jgi:hypothetical protein
MPDSEHSNRGPRWVTQGLYEQAVGGIISGTIVAVIAVLATEVLWVALLIASVIAVAVALIIGGMVRCRAQQGQPIEAPPQTQHTLPLNQSLGEARSLSSDTATGNQADLPSTPRSTKPTPLPSLGSDTVPYIYGRPVLPDEFVGREPELRSLFNRLRNGESTAIVGDPHMGKTSLLLKMADEATHHVYYHADGGHTLLISSVNLHHIHGTYTPKDFWTQALEPLRRHPKDAAMSQCLEATSETGYDGDSLERVFRRLRRQRRRFVLLLDEFERLLFHQHFQDFAFFATLRTLSSLPSFCLITSSRLSLDRLNSEGHKLPGSGGSPLFNTLIEIRLPPLSEEAVGALLDRAGDAFTLNDTLFIRRVAGRHPFLVQAMAASLLETEGDDRCVRAAERFYGEIRFHFDELWNTLDDGIRTTAVILSLVELGGRAFGQRFAYGEIERVGTFGPELRKLAERGLAERIGKGWQFDREHLLLWQGEQWTVGTQAFAWWVRDVVITETRRLPEYDQWLASKRYLLLLTQEQWDQLCSVVRGAPEWAARGTGALARALLAQLTRRQK